MKVAKWGNSLAIRLPVDVTEVLAIKEGDEIELHPIEQGHFAVRRKPTREEMWAAVRKLRGAMPKDFKFSRDEIYDRD